jgi:hypothetical protein
MASKRRRVINLPVRTISTRRVKSSQEKQDKVQASNQLISQKPNKVQSSKNIEKSKPITDNKPKELDNNDKELQSDTNNVLKIKHKPTFSKKIHKCQICLKVFKGKIRLSQ